METEAVTLANIRKGDVIRMHGLPGALEGEVVDVVVGDVQPTEDGYSFVVTPAN